MRTLALLLLLVATPAGAAEAPTYDPFAPHAWSTPEREARYERGIRLARVGLYGFWIGEGVGLLGLGVMLTGLALDEPGVAVAGVPLVLVGGTAVLTGPVLTGLGGHRAARALSADGRRARTWIGPVSVVAWGAGLAGMTVASLRRSALLDGGADTATARRDAIVRASSFVGAVGCVGGLAGTAAQLDEARHVHHRRDPHPGRGEHFLVHLQMLDAPGLFLSGTF